MRTRAFRARACRTKSTRFSTAQNGFAYHSARQPRVSRSILTQSDPFCAAAANNPPCSKLRLPALHCANLQRRRLEVLGLGEQLVPLRRPGLLLLGRHRRGRRRDLCGRPRDCGLVLGRPGLERAEWPVVGGLQLAAAQP
jgi:hypothetical protein